MGELQPRICNSSVSTTVENNQKSLPFPEGLCRCFIIDPLYFSMLFVESLTFSNWFYPFSYKDASIFYAHHRFGHVFNCHPFKSNLICSMNRHKKIAFIFRWRLPGALGFEPRTCGFGDRYSTSWTIPLYKGQGQWPCPVLPELGSNQWHHD